MVNAQSDVHSSTRNIQARPPAAERNRAQEEGLERARELTPKVEIPRPGWSGRGPYKEPMAETGSPNSYDISSLDRLVSIESKIDKLIRLFTCILRPSRFHKERFRVHDGDERSRV